MLYMEEPQGLDGPRRSDRIRTVTLGSNFTVRIFSKSCGNLGGEVAKTLLKHLFY